MATFNLQALAALIAIGMAVYSMTAERLTDRIRVLIAVASLLVFAAAVWAL